MTVATPTSVGFTKTLLLAGLILCSNAKALDLGIVGPTYAIAETNLLEVIEQRVNQLEPSLVDRWKARAQMAVDRPKGRVLPRATTNQLRRFDPSIQVQESIRDEHGKVIIAKGTWVNPLRVNPLPNALCFIDADDQAQVGWAQKRCVDDQVVLVNGSPTQTAKALKRRIYFDQHSKLVDVFQIEALPVVLSSDREVVYVRTVALP